MPATIRLGAAFLWLLTACPPFPESETCDVDDCPSTSPLPVTSEPLLPTTSSGQVSGFQTVTGDQEPVSTGGPEPVTASAGTSSTGEPGEPEGLPVILQVELEPETIMANGPIQVTAQTAHADGVHLVLDNGQESELLPGLNGEFSGSFDVLTALDNGTRHVHLTPWRAAVGDPVVGLEVKTPYEVILPKAGSPLWWETSDELGPGQVAALGVLPDDQVVEFGTYFTGNEPRCYLRRRDKQGAVNATELLLKDKDCTAVDLQIDAAGTLFVLVNRTGGDGVRWWYGRISAWGQGATPVKDGDKDEAAVALARHPSGEIAVCGYAPTPSVDVDAMVHVFAPNVVGGKKLKFDYQPPDKLSHWFEERPRDCVYTGDTLALVGEAFGRHDLELVKRERLFILRVDTAAASAQWMVDTPSRDQSAAQAVDVDGDGRLVVAGYNCDDACQPAGELRIYDADNTPVWLAPLGTFQSKIFAVKDVAWSPAGYAVVATGGVKGAEGAFTVRAFGPEKVLPLWTFTHKDIMTFDLALALALGRLGEVYAGGLGVDKYPAVAYIAG